MEILIFVILVALSGFFSAAETAFFSLSHSKIRLMKKQSAFNAHLIERLKKHPEKLLITILIGNTVANLSAGAYTTAVAIDSFGSVGVGIITGITAIIILLVSEIMPKSFAYNNNVRVAQYIAYPLFISSIIFWPISYILDTINRKLNKNTGGKSHNHISEDEVLIMSRMSVEKGGIGYDEHELIEKIFRFDDIKVGSAMTAFPRISFINGEVPVDNIAYFISQTEHSRYPVYEGSTDNIVGYIHVNMIMKALNSDGRNKPVSEFMVPIDKIDENVSLERAFRALNRRQAHMCLVHAHKNENKIVGLITLEDILEELVGEIEDETDMSK